MAGGVAEAVVILLVKDELYRGVLGKVKYKVGHQLQCKNAKTVTGEICPFCCIFNRKLIASEE